MIDAMTLAPSPPVAPADGPPSRWDAVRHRLAGLLVRFLAGLVIAAATIGAAIGLGMRDLGQWDGVTTFLFAAGLSVALTSVGFAAAVLCRHRSLWRPPRDVAADGLPAPLNRYERGQAERRERTRRMARRLASIWLAAHALAVLPLLRGLETESVVAFGLWWCLSLPLAAGVGALAFWQREFLPWRWVVAGVAPWAVHVIEATAVACFVAF